MAGARYALSSSPRSPASRSVIVTRLTVAAISSSSPLKLTRRKNYLRQKLLKTLTKTCPTPLVPLETPENSRILSETLQVPREQELEIDSDGNLVGCSGEIGRQENADQKELESNVVCVTGTDTAGVSSTVGVVSCRSVLEMALYVVGLFVFQSICAVWVFGSADTVERSKPGDGDLELEANGLEISNCQRKEDSLLNRSENDFRNFLGSKPGGVHDTDVSQYKGKIAKIRAMAREARESERKALGANDLVSSSDVVEDSDFELAAETANSGLKTGIQKEVDERLLKLRKNLDSLRGKSLMPSVSYLSNSRQSRGVENVNTSVSKWKSETSLLKNKHKFRSSTTNIGKNPKGFQGLKDPKGFQSLKDRSVSNESGRKNVSKDTSLQIRDTADNGTNVSVREQELDPTDSDSLEKKMMDEGDSYLFKDKVLDTSLPDVSKIGKDSVREELNSIQIMGKKLNREVNSLKRGVGMGAKHTEAKTGGISCSGHERLLAESVNPKESSKLKTQFSQSSGQEDWETPAISNKQAESSRNVSSRHLLQNREVGKKQIVNKSINGHSELNNDLQGLNLPYALAILLRRGSDPEGPRGLYTLKINSHSQDEHCLSYTVAFEDRTDATNFCYLLESFFEGLEDFRADIVPFSIKELDMAVKSRTMKVIVVRKGQLRLYAGQPLADVEMALRSFVE